MNGTALVLVGAGETAALEALRRSRLRLAFAAVAGHAVVFPDHADYLQLPEFEALAQRFHLDFSCPVLAMSRCVGGVLWLGLLKESRLLVDYDSLSLTLPWDDYATTLFELTEDGLPWHKIHFYLKSRHIPFDWLRQRLILKSIGLPTWIAGESYARLRHTPSRGTKRGVDLGFTADSRVLRSWHDA